MITVLNFDSVYEKQEHLQDKHYQWLDFQSLTNTNLFCEQPTLQNIADKIHPYHKNQIRLIGSGNYHYITYLFLKQLKNPFTFLLFDHHTDTLKSPSEDLISCGSWVLEALHRLPNLKQAIIVGVSEDGEEYIDSSIEEKVRLYSKHAIRLHPKKALDNILNTIDTEEVYISIDKDVLDTKDAVTAWDHGNMRLRELLSYVKEVMKMKTVCGVDICGEYPIHPNNEFKKQTIEANKKNSRANRTLVYYLSKWLKQKEYNSDSLHA